MRTPELEIIRIETVYPAPRADEDDYCPDGEATDEELFLSFRELVELLRHNTPSCSHPTGATFEWVTTEPYIDFRTGDTTEVSLHWSGNNPPHRARYWRLAMRAAGLIRN